jgi:NTE family protein
MTHLYYLCFALMALLLSGCTSYGVIDNSPKKIIDKDLGYSWRAWTEGEHHSDLTVMVSFSGGGTRAAALAYGVLQGLSDTTIPLEGKPTPMLSMVDYISSVSGGSFTAAYYGLYGERIFEDFEADFLLRDVEKHLFWGVANPLNWFRQGGRTEMAIRYYNDKVFHGATFADMNIANMPLILINASEMGHGVRFSFIQEYFNLICSDMDSFPVAKAVTASSAVPLVFLPVVLEKYPDCGSTEPEWLTEVKASSGDDPLVNEVIDGMEVLLKKDQLRYIHLVDGGITDNLGLHALYDIFTMAGGAGRMAQKLKKKPPSHLVIISVNASTDPEPTLDLSNKEPSIGETISAMSDVQLHRYNTTTLELMKTSLKKWVAQLSTPEHQVKPYFIRVGLRNVKEPDKRLFFNQIPTSFSLSQEQVDQLALAGKSLLQNNPEYQRLIKNLGGKIGAEN